jgi:hypothetical protein
MRKERGKLKDILPCIYPCGDPPEPDRNPYICKKIEENFNENIPKKTT